MPELRHDPITGRSVIIASERAKRPRQQLDRPDPTLKEAEPCAFCPGNEALTPPEVWALRKDGTRADQPGWSVRVVPNKYPALESSGASIAKKDGIYESASAIGAHEVIIESPEHLADMGSLNVGQWTDVVRAYQARLAALGSNLRWRYLLLYKNQGDRAGATLEHVHSQIVAMAVLPPSMVAELNRAQTHRESTGRCVYCEMIHSERASERRVMESQKFIALCPFAPRFAYETWVLPRSHTAAFEQNTDETRADLALFLRDFFLRLNRVLDRPPLNYVIHSQPPRAEADGHFHWRMEILPQLNRAAGFEWGSGLWMNPLPPEEAARLLRDPL
jgi:UDPglucose--hexose-1-phosphate uridylyltransferase